MKNKRNLIIALIVIIAVAIVIGVIYAVIRINNPTLKAVVLEVSDKGLNVTDKKAKTLYQITIPSDNNLKFKQKQEILIYYKDKDINKNSFPVYINDVTKIKILKEESNAKFLNPSITGVVKNFTDNTITVMNIKDNSLWTADIPDNNKLEFKKGQEVEIFYEYGTIIEETIPAHIRDVNKIKILKQKSNVEIPGVEVYIQKNNIKAEIEEFSTDRLVLNIDDKNEYKSQYKDYSNEFTISKRGSVGSSESKDVHIKNIDNNITQLVFDLKPICVNLEPGDYIFRTYSKNELLEIYMIFNIDENKEITYNEPKISFKETI